jgi:uncharacterized membrane protein YhaH (DUF805 family)
MSFPEAISTVFRRDLAFGGRASRSEYWWFWLFYVLVVVAMSFILVVLPDSPPSGLFVGVTWIAIPAVFLNCLAAAVRRLHVTGRSGWWCFISLIPPGGIILTVLLAIKGTPGLNKYGPPPGVEAILPVPPDPLPQPLPTVAPSPIEGN